MKESLLDWKVLFDILLPQYSDSIEYEIDGNQLTLIADLHMGDAIKAELAEKLKSRAALYKALPYKIEQMFQEEKDHDLIEIPLPPTNYEECIELFESLVGEEVMEQCELASAFPPSSRFDNGILISPAFSKRVETIKLPKLQFLLTYFSYATQDQIRQAWIDPHFYIPEPTNHIEVLNHLHRQAADLKVEGDLQNYFGSMTVEKDVSKSQLFIDVLKFYWSIFPPIFTNEQTSAKILFKFDLQHLYSYMRSLLVHEHLLRVTIGDHNEIQARPIFFVEDLSQEKRTNMHILLIDISDSMKSSFDSLSQYISGYFQELAMIDPSASVRLVFFNSIAIDYEVPHAGNGLNELIAKVLRADPGDTTRLYDTVQENLKKAIQELELRGATVITVFTDGKNNVGSETSVGIDQLMSTLTKSQKEQLLIYTFGYGKAHDKILLQKLATDMHGIYTPLSSTKDFNLIVSELGRRLVGRKLIDFIEHLQGENLEPTRISVPRDGAPHVLHVKFALNSLYSGIIQVNDKPINISVPDPTKIPQKNTTDLLTDIQTAAAQLTSIATMEEYDVILPQFKELLAKVQNIKDQGRSLSSINLQYAEHLTTTINSAIDKLVETRQQCRDTVSTKALRDNVLRTSPPSLEQQPPSASNTVTPHRKYP